LDPPRPSRRRAAARCDGVGGHAVDRGSTDTVQPGQRPRARARRRSDSVHSSTPLRAGPSTSLRAGRWEARAPPRHRPVSQRALVLLSRAECRAGCSAIATWLMADGSWLMAMVEWTTSNHQPIAISPQPLAMTRVLLLA